MDEIERLKKDQDATILAHFDGDGDIQDVADFTGDRLKLARDATKTSRRLWTVSRPSYKLSIESAQRAKLMADRHSSISELLT